MGEKDWGEEGQVTVPVSVIGDYVLFHFDLSLFRVYEVEAGSGGPPLSLLRDCKSVQEPKLMPNIVY